MKKYKISIYLFSDFIESETISAQSILDLYSAGIKDRLIIEASLLIHTPEPTIRHTDQLTETNNTFVVVWGFDQVNKLENRFFTVHDDKNKFAKQLDNTQILVYGVASNANLYIKTARLLQVVTQAEVNTMDLRGHGQSDGNRINIQYINEYVDDLANITGRIRKEKPNGKIIIEGHSMGGGIVLCFAMENRHEQAYAHLLFAQLTGQNSPALRRTQASENIVKVSFMDLFDSVSLRKYSYRTNKSIVPDGYVAGLKAISKTMIVLKGSKDEVFSSASSKEAILKNGDGEFHIIDKASHDGVFHNAQSFTFIND